VNAAVGVGGKAKNVPYIFRHFLYPYKSDATVELTGIVLAASRRSVYTFSEPQAIDNNKAMVSSKLVKHKTNLMNPTPKRYLKLVI
jgi:hypothetical protein